MPLVCHGLVIFFDIYISKAKVLFILAPSNSDMKKAILLGASLLILAAGMSSCKKCYMCTRSYTAVVNGNDSLVVIRAEFCNKGAQGAGANLNSTIKDVEANGYLCVSE